MISLSCTSRYPNYKYTPKKKDTPKRVYVRKNKKEQFTSRASENNKIMEMIYEDPTALENIDGVVEAKPKSACKANKATKKNTKVSKERAGNTVAMENVYEDCGSDDYSEVDFKNEIYRSPCQYASSVYSTQTVPDFYFDSPQATSPSTDCYSDSDMQSPYAEPSPLDDFQLSYQIVPSSSSSSVSTSSAATADFSLLDTPFINDLNAYSPMPLEAQLDYFQFDASNINFDINTPNNNNIKYYPEEFCWNECPNYMFTQECQQSIVMQMSQPVQFIDPSILHNNM